MSSRRAQLLSGLGMGVVVLALVSIYDPFAFHVSQPGAGSTGLVRPARDDSVSGTLVALGQRIEELEAENRGLRAELGEVGTLQERLQRIESRPPLRKLHEYPLPERVEFCGQLLPLDDAEVYQRFESEFYRFLVNRHWLVNWKRRARDVFPYLEARLARAGLPDDLKYIAVIESALDPRATSPAGAAGYWQFIVPTARRYGLIHNRSLDQRRDLYEATEAAIAYLSDLYAEFESWPLALSSYNAGESRVRESVKLQGTSEFYDLLLPRETEAYWFRGAAVKALFERAEHYDLVLVDDGWEISVCDTLLVTVHDDRLPILDVLAQSSLNYRDFNRFNPSFRRSYLPKGTHRLAIPRTEAAGVLQALPRAKRISSSSPESPGR